MTDRFHVGTFVWGLVLTVAGAVLATVGLGWWDIAALDLRYAAPLSVIVIGAVILLGALTSSARRDRSDHDPGT